MTDQQHVKDEPNAKSKSSSRPWIISLAYWNDVAKDVVKAACIAFVIYLGGVIAGIFKLHIEVVIGVIAALAAILIWTIKPFLDERFSLSNGIFFGVTWFAAAVFVAFVFPPSIGVAIIVGQQHLDYSRTCVRFLYSGHFGELGNI
jgi:hypothetical protein